MPTAGQFAAYFAFLGTIVVAAVALPTTGVVLYARNSAANDEQEASFQSRMREKLNGASLTVITASAFSKGHEACDRDHPYGADFTAKDTDNKVATGTVCTAANRESIIAGLKR